MACTLPASPVSFLTHPSIPLGSATSGSQFLLRCSYIHIIANAVPSAWNALPSFQGNFPSRQTTYHSSRQLKDHLLYVFTLIHLVGVSYSPLLCPNCLLVYFHYTVALNGKDPAHFISVPPVPSTTPSMSQICACVWVAQLCLTLTPWTVCSPPGFFSVHEISQARLDGVAISFSRGSSWPRDWTHISHIGRRVLYHWPTREALNWKSE